MYLKDDERPPVGEGLNRAAEVTLMNVRGPSASSLYTQIGPACARKVGSALEGALRG